jgi:MFS family permease
MDHSTPSVGYSTLLRRNRNYRSLWFGEIVSLFGDWFNLIASASLISSLTESGLAVGGLFVIRMLAPFLVSPVAGVFADRFNRRRLLIASDLARAAVVTGFLFVRQPEHVWILYVLTAVQLAISGFFFPARNSMLPDIVSPGELGTANALSSATWSVMLAVGSAAGGLVAGEWGIYPAFVIDALTFLLSAFFISRIRYQPKPAEARPAGLGAALGEYLEGLKYLQAHPDIFAVSLHKAAISLTVSGVFQVITVTLAERVYVIGEGGGTSLGLLSAAAGVGTGLGPILARRFTGDRDGDLRRALSWSYVISVLGLALTAPLAGFGVVMLGNLIRAFGGGVNWVFSTQILLKALPDRLRGRIFSTEFAFFTLGNAVSAAAGGWLLDSGLGISGSLWVITVLTMIPGLLWMLWMRSHPRTVLVDAGAELTVGPLNH